MCGEGFQLASVPNPHDLSVWWTHHTASPCEFNNETMQQLAAPWHPLPQDDNRTEGVTALHLQQAGGVGGDEVAQHLRHACARLLERAVGLHHHADEHAGRARGLHAWVSQRDLHRLRRLDQHALGAALEKVRRVRDAPQEQPVGRRAVNASERGGGAEACAATRR